MHDVSPEACEWVAPLLVHYVSGELHCDETEAVVLHLAHCSRCRDRLTLDRALTRRLREMRRVEVPDRLERRVRRSLRGDPEPSRSDV